MEEKKTTTTTMHSKGQSSMKTKMTEQVLRNGKSS